MSIDNQSEYWDKVAYAKTFTHPLNKEVLTTRLSADSKILDFGCGYGRIVKELSDVGFTNVVGYDTSKELVGRGRQQNNLSLFHITSPLDLPVRNNSVDCILLFAVLTCIPSNNGQKELLKLLRSKLKPEGIIYISDYYLQNNSPEVKRYQYFNDDEDNFGVFKLSEGVTFRHHTREWISELTKEFKILLENPIQVMTMNGHTAEAFQLVGQK
ncbi:class I SAM-dependent methyltransferase [Niabella soli]|uniref:Type 12 methyltransferase n=1 Tax=Niabella soli DSM 19437 TaxID=929713 RepID=W0F297_9BACT|nr:class I SAM-dependent methyltransferase [Niabella soli]AHF15614.1 type 12 methyltransferase [Niabella soli DSM 19437]